MNARELLARLERGAGEATIQYRVGPPRYEVTMPDGTVETVPGDSAAALRRAHAAVDAWVARWSAGRDTMYVLTTTVHHYDAKAGGAK